LALSGKPFREADAGEYFLEVQSEGSVFERRTSDSVPLTVLSTDPAFAPRFEDLVYLLPAATSQGYYRAKVVPELK